MAAFSTRGEQRRGRGSITARRVGDETVFAELRADNPLRFVRPTFPNTKSAAACIVTFGGGLVDGDDIAVDVTVEAGATLVLFTQSTTKAFRGSSRQSLHAKVDGTLVWLPDPVSAFKDASYTQRVDVELGANGACVLLDGFTSGRAAFGERWIMEALDLRTTVRDHDGRRSIVVDALKLHATSTQRIDQRVAAYEAFATLFAIGQGAKPIIDCMLQSEADAPPNRDLIVTASPLPRAHDIGVPAAVVRVAASSPSHAMDAVRSKLRNLPDIDAVDPFASRY